MNKWKRIAFTDLSTGIKNRNFYEYNLKHKKNYECSIAFIDVNGLKSLNDTKGHRAGDDLIYEVAQVLDNFEIAFRYGGDEFVVCSTLKTSDIKTKLKQIQKDYPISYGIVYKSKYDLWRNAIEQADSEMYKMKQKMKVTREDLEESKS